MSTLISSNVVNPFYIWWGQIVDESNWIKNINPKNHARDDVAGWGPCRCKVRIFGRDTRTKEHVDDDQLEWAEVILPVTAGSGHAGSMQTPNIRQGSYVIGFYKDGINATQPIIFGVLPNNSQTRLFGGDTEENFIPRTGYKGGTGDKPVSTKNIYSEGPSSTFYRESSDSNLNTVNQQDQQKDGERCHYVPKTRACDGPSGELKGIQRFIKNALSFINRIKAEANSFIGAASDLSSLISSIVDEAALFITNLMKTLLDKMRGYVVNKLNNGVKDLMEILTPNTRATANEANEKATDILQCVFNKIMQGLLALIKQLLEDIIDKYVNAPMCAVENFISSILSNILGDITAGIDSAMAAIDGILGDIGDAVGQVFNALDVLVGILKFLSCDEELDCTMGEEWSFWGGAKCASENVRSDIGKFFNDTISGLGPTNAPPCNTSAIPCGPPNISITGGGGAGVLGNPIISATGAILGIDFVSGGSGYVSPPTINILDDCGKGGGAVVVPIISSQSTTTSSVSPTTTTINDSNGNPLTYGGTGGTPVTAGGSQVSVGATGGTPVTSGGSGGIPITSGGSPVSVGGTTLSVGAVGGTPVSVGGTTLSVGGTGGLPLTSGGTGGTEASVVEGGGGTTLETPLNLPGVENILSSGGSGGTPLTTGGLSITSGGSGGTPLIVGGSGGTPLTSGGLPVTAGGSPVSVGGTGGIPVTSGGLPVTAGATGGSPVSVGSVGGTPVIAGESPAIVVPIGVPDVGLIGNTPVNVLRNPTNQTLITDDGIVLGIGGTGGIPISFDGLPVTSNTIPLNGNPTGAANVVIGGNGEPVTTSNGDVVSINAIGGSPVTINGNPVTISGVPLTVGGTGGTPINSVGTDLSPSIIGAAILDPGNGYLSSPDGDLGGNGSVWAPKDYTIVQRTDGTLDTPYRPGSVVDVNPGDSVKYPGQSPITIIEPQTITAPPYEPPVSERDDSPSTSNGSYPVILTITDALVTNPGVAYLPTDTIKIIPDNGAVLEPKFDDQGRLSDVSVVNGGIGFTDFPKIIIESQQGINAKVVPIFGIIRIGDLPEDQDIIPPGTGIISVVDCVGRIK